MSSRVRVCSQNPDEDSIGRDEIKQMVRKGGFISIIVWIDATKRDDLKADDPPAPELGVTAGFIIQKNRRQVVIAGEVFADGHARDVTTIPAKMVLGIFKIGRFQVPKELWKHVG